MGTSAGCKAGHDLFARLCFCRHQGTPTASQAFKTTCALEAQVFGVTQPGKIKEGDRSNSTGSTCDQCLAHSPPPQTPKQSKSTCTFSGMRNTD